MTKTKYYDLQMDDPQDDYDVEVVNANLEKIDEQMKTRENATDALQEPEFTVADKRENIASKEKMQKILGKIAKFFTDLKTVAFTGNYKDLSNKPTSLPASDVSAWAKESTKPKYTKAEVGLGNVGNFKAVSTVASQGLTNTEKSNARANIGAQAAGSYASSTHNHDSTYRKKLLGTMDGDGKTSYCQLCTLKISQNYINTPIEITLQERCRSTLDRLSILFGSINNTNPSLDRFTVFGESCDWYISKTAASTWVIYGLKGESWAGIKVVDYTGIPGIDITWNMTGVSSLPDSKTQALWGGNVHYAETAGNVVNNQTTTKAGFALDARQANPNLDGTLAKQVADLNGSLENYITVRHGYFGTSGTTTSWIQISDFQQMYQYGYSFPDVDGYKFLVGFTNISWTNGNKYFDYMPRNYILNTQSGNVEMYSEQGTPSCVMYFFGLYIKS